MNEVILSNLKNDAWAPLTYARNGLLAGVGAALYVSEKVEARLEQTFPRNPLLVFGVDVALYTSTCLTGFCLGAAAGFALGVVAGIDGLAEGAYQHLTGATPQRSWIERKLNTINFNL